MSPRASGEPKSSSGLPVIKTVENENGEEEEDRFFFLRTYTVFYVDQVEGTLDHLRAGQADTGEPLIDYQPAEDAIEATGATQPLRWGQGVLSAHPRTTSKSPRKPLSSP